MRTSDNLLIMFWRASPSEILPKLETSSDRSRKFPDTSCSNVADGLAKLRREVRNRFQETAKELGEEENRIVKELIAGREVRLKDAEKPRWADMKESEATGESKMTEEVPDETRRRQARRKQTGRRCWLWRTAMLHVCQVCVSVVAGWTTGALPKSSGVCWTEAVSSQHASPIQAFGCNGMRVIPATAGVLWIHFRFHQVLVSVGGFGVREWCSLSGSGWSGWLSPGIATWTWMVPWLCCGAGCDACRSGSRGRGKFLAFGLYFPCDRFQNYVFFAGAALLAASSAEISSCTWANAGAAAAFCQRENLVLVPASCCAPSLLFSENFGKAEGKTQVHTAYAKFCHSSLR